VFLINKSQSEINLTEHISTQKDVKYPENLIYWHGFLWFVI